MEYVVMLIGIPVIFWMIYVLLNDEYHFEKELK
jgi:hypothetical protein